MAKFNITNSKGDVHFTVDDCEGDLHVASNGTCSVLIGDAVLNFDNPVLVEEVTVENFTDTFYVDLDDLGDEIYQAVMDNGGTESQADACRSAAYGASVAVTVEVMVEDEDVDVEDVYLN